MTATKNPVTASNALQILPLQHPAPDLTSRPIPLNPLSFLINSLTDTTAWRDTHLAILTLKERHTPLVAVLAVSPAPPRGQIGTTPFISASIDSSMLQQSSLSFIYPNPAHGPSPLRPNKRTTQQCYSLSPPKAYMHPNSTRTRMAVSALSKHLNVSPPLPGRHVMPAPLQCIFSSSRPGRQFSYEIDETAGSQDTAHQPATEDRSLIQEIQMDGTHPPATPSVSVSKRPKVKKNPTRRSQRLQARATQPIATPAKKMKTQKPKSLFSPDSQLDPLDTSKALHILQASGLLIDKTIEDLVDDAVKRD